jgi:hypothetical protein
LFDEPLEGAPARFAAPSEEHTGVRSKGCGFPTTELWTLAGNLRERAVQIKTHLLSCAQHIHFFQTKNAIPLTRRVKPMSSQFERSQLKEQTMTNISTKTLIVLAFGFVYMTGCVEEDATLESAENTVQQDLREGQRTPDTSRADSNREAEATRVRTAGATRTTDRSATSLRPANQPAPGDIDISIEQVYVERTSTRGTYKVTLSVKAFNYSRIENLYSAFTLNNSNGVEAARRIRIEQSRTKNFYRVVFEGQFPQGSYAAFADPDNLIDETIEYNNAFRFFI